MSEEDRHRLEKFSDEDIHAMLDLVRMYREGKAALWKALIYAVVGSIVTALGIGIRSYINNPK